MKNQNLPQKRCVSQVSKILYLPTYRLMMMQLKQLALAVLFTLFYLGVPLSVVAQFSDNFSDLELTSNPTWQGTLSTFIINTDSVLQVNDTDAGSSNISTGFTSTLLDNVEWQFWIRQSFSGSTNNNGRVYLASDQADVSGALNGYFIQFGEAGSDDAIELFRQNGIINTSVARGTDGLISGSFDMRVRVRRDASGNWEIGIDQAGGTDFVLETMGTDNTITSTTNFGILCTYTASNADNFFFDDIYMGAYILDLTPPEVVSVSVISPTQLDVLFSEPVSQPTAENAVNFSVDGGIGNPATAVLNGGLPTLVNLTFATAFTNGTQYQLTVSNVEDVAGNTMATTTEPFQYVVTVAATFREVVINEFAPDPSPVIGLPEAEYIEVFNTSNNYIDIEGWRVSDASSTGTVQSYILGPGEYVLLVANADLPLFSFAGNAVGVTSFPSLNNSGDEIILQDAGEVLIDRLTYDLSWYNDVEKQSGGYSIEQINPFLSCSKADNWSGSEHFNGGTPNLENSVFDDLPDTEGPSLVTVNISGSQQVELQLSEPLDSTTVTAASILFDPFLNVASAASNGPEHLDITVLLSTAIDTGIYYSVTISGLNDCEGNPQSADSVLTFILPFTPDSGDLVINEVLFNPVTGGADYVELMNTSNRVVNLKGWMLANFDVDDGISGYRTMIDKNYAIDVGGFVLLTEDTAQVMATYIGHGIGNLLETDIPPYNNDSGTVYLLNFDSLVTEWFSYDEDMHFPLLDDVNGVSLERLDVNRDIADNGNWHSAAQTAGFGTPGLQNSQYFPTSEADGEVSVDPDIFSPYDFDGNSDILNINYKFTQSGNVATIRIYDANGRPIRQLVSNQLLGASGVFKWDGTTDTGGKARIGMYIILFEAFNPEGKTSTYKISTVLGGNL